MKLLIKVKNIKAGLDRAKIILKQNEVQQLMTIFSDYTYNDKDHAVILIKEKFNFLFLQEVLPKIYEEKDYMLKK